MDGTPNLVEQLEKRGGYLTVAQLAAFMGWHPQTVYKAINSARNPLPCVRAHGLRFDPVEVAGWLRGRYSNL
jgi:hypothetical protein